MAETNTVLSNLATGLSAPVNLKTVIGIGTGGLVLSASGILPKVGLGRAITFALRSALFSGASIRSVRQKDIQSLTLKLNSMEKGNYIVVTGGKGVGKSCLIDTALDHTFGVAKISTKSGEDKNEIMKTAQRAITNISSTRHDLSANTRRVLLFYNLIFRRPPIVVIRVPERQQGEPYAQVTGAVRGLADEFGLKVIVDGSPNSIPPETNTTNRQNIMDIKPMERDLIESIPEFSEMITFLKKHGLADGVWKVLGGNPSYYVNMKGVIIEAKLQFNIQTDDPSSNMHLIEAVKSYTYGVLYDALFEKVNKSSENTEKLIEFFRERKLNRIPSNEIKAQGFRLDYPNKVFRQVKVGDDSFVEPATPAVGLIIHHNITDAKGMRAFHKTLFEVKE